MEKIRKSAIILPVVLLASGIVFGAGLGWSLSETRNIENTEYITQFDTALPSKLLDINGELITEFASDEKREIISLQNLPQHMIDALLTREDRIFYSHHGFSFKAVFRAVVGVLTHTSLGGGSTLTQQIAGTLYCDRTDMSVRRKIKELWWAVQMERRYSKNEILELYLNKIYFGGGTYGVNAASKYYFGHSAESITPAEAAILVIQLSNPAYYNPFDHPNRAMERQQDVLKAMVKAGYLSKAEAEESYDNYRLNFDYTRTSTSAYFMRDDKAPWFSEYVRRELESMIYGSQDIYTSGFTVNTTLNLSHQQAAQEIMTRYINRANVLYRNDTSIHASSAYRTYVPFSELLALLYNLPGIKLSNQRVKAQANAAYINKINPMLDICSLMFGLENMKADIVNRANSISKEDEAKTTIEGTMIAIENETGYITALVGGSKFEQDNQYIRAVQAKLQPGSTFKPLYYSAAIDTRNFTPATEISDTPVVFHRSDGKPYIPQNFRGEWQGNVQLWYALAHSMNVPSLKILDGIGFDAAISRALALLDIPKDEIPSRGFVPGYPIGLGVCSVKPIEMARAFAVFANGGKAVTPIAVRTVEDRDGNVVLNPELEVRKAQQTKGTARQVISPQTAFVMTHLLENTVESGTLAAQSGQFVFTNKNGRKYTMPAAGKTGTTQNWADAWTVGFTPYYTAAFWFGFDMPGQSLGLNITGSTLAGFAWGEFMHAANKDLPVKNFPKPVSGVSCVTVCAESGQLPTPQCGSNLTTQWFLSGTEPTVACQLHSNSENASIFYNRLQDDMVRSGQQQTQQYDDTPLSLDLDFLKNDSATPNTTDSSDQTNGTVPQNSDTTDTTETSAPEYNYLLE